MYTHIYIYIYIYTFFFYLLHAPLLAVILHASYYMYRHYRHYKLQFLVTLPVVFSSSLPDMCVCVYIYIYIYAYTKVKFTIEQATKAQMCSRGIALLFL